MLFDIDYKEVLYRRNNQGRPTFWYAYPTGERQYTVHHGIVGMDGMKDHLTTHRKAKDEIATKVNNKRKKGYKYLAEIKDNTSFPVEKSLYDYLNTYLPTDRTDASGALLPMLAKSFDNKDDRLFKKVSLYITQWKINGLRCFISAERNSNSLFNEVRFIFRSREGNIWTSLKNLEEYLLTVLNEKLIELMVEEDYILDGEIYLPGYTVNQIDHIAKDPTCPENQLIQFWCYDLAVDNVLNGDRYELLYYYQHKNLLHVYNREDHLNVKTRFNVLCTYNTYNEDNAIMLRDTFIDYGFEGAMFRNPAAEYQFGKRNLSLIKFKRHTDGKFDIVDIKPEGTKRPDIPLFVCKNDINDNQFEVHIGGSLDYQRRMLTQRDYYIGKRLYIEYGERSGVAQVPFHVKLVKLA